MPVSHTKESGSEGREKKDEKKVTSTEVWRSAKSTKVWRSE
jgi:hypothetical protein